MGQGWFVKHGSETLGPMSRAELVEFVAGAEAGLSTEVRRGVQGQWLHAGSVGGLLQPENGGQDISAKASAGQVAKQPDDGAGINPYQPTALPASDQVMSPDARAGSGLKMTRMGLLTCYYGVCVVLIGVLGACALSVCSFVFISSASFPSGIVWVVTVGLLTVGVSTLGGIAFLVGQVLCVSVPIESGARGYMKVVLSLHVAWLVIAVGGTAVFELMGGMGGPGFIIEELVSSLRVVPEFVGLVCFVTALKKLSLYLELPDLASTASSVRRLVILLGVLGIVFPPAVLFFMETLGIAEWFYVSSAILTALTALVACIRFSNLLVHLARAIPRSWE